MRSLDVVEWTLVQPFAVDSRATLRGVFAQADRVLYLADNVDVPVESIVFKQGKIEKEA